MNAAQPNWTIFMDWTLAINRNREALLRIIATLYALAGLANGAQFSALPRFTYKTILQVLRPAEAAVRRLIILAAYGLQTPNSKNPLNTTSTAPHWQNFDKQVARFAAFPLIDPLKHFATRDYEPNDSTVPRISLPGYLDPAFLVPSQSFGQDATHAAHLSNRLLALTRALANLNNQARRLARWQARRDAALSQSISFKPRRLTPLRPGSPPGSRQRRIHEVDHILRECHMLVLDRLADTS
jgi:hypothetical protein